MKILIAKFWPLFFIFLVWFIFASPYFLNGKVPYSSTYQVNHFFPWSAYPKFHGPVKNGAMPDITDQIYPWRHFTIETWKNGEIPAWNPNSFSGNPHLANYQSAVFSPLNLMFFVLPFVDAWSLLVLLSSLTSGIFTYLLMREFKISKLGSSIASIAFMFSGFMVVWMAYGTLSWAIAFLPLALFAIERWFQKGGTFPLILLALSLPLSFFSGHFQTSLYFLLFVSIFLGFKIFQRHKKTLPVILAFLLGFVVSLLQIVPSIQFYLESPRSEIFTKDVGIPFFYLISTFAPDFFGNPVTRNDWFGPYAEWASFVGIIPLTLALFAFSKRNKTSLFFFITGLIFLVLAIDSPIQDLVSGMKLPVISTSNPTRIIVLFSFAVAVLSGFGLDRLSNLKKTIKITVILALLLVFLAGWISIFILISPDNSYIAQRNFIIPSFVFILFSFIIFLNPLLKFKKNILLYALLLIVAFDSLRFAQKWMPFDPKELAFIETPVIEGIRRNIGHGRIFGNFGANLDTYYNFPSIEGYDPLYIDRYGEFIRSADTGGFLEGERSVVKLGRRGELIDRVIDLLGVSLIFHPTADTNQGWAYPVWEDKSRFVQIFQDGNLELYRNHSALERARIFYNYEVIKDKKEIIKRFYSNDFNFRNTLILEENPSMNSKLEERRPDGNAEIVSYEPNKVVIQVKTEAPALLFLSDNFYPGWRAKVNGEEKKIYRADYSFRAVEVPKGQSLVEFYYRFL